MTATNLFNFTNRQPASNSPLVVCWGMGQDSTGMLIGMWERGIKPQLIITADVGSERPETYGFKLVFDDWLESVGFSRSVTVRYQPGDYKHWPPYYSLLENCLTNVTLPSLAYGYHTCSAKWKITPINKYLAGLSWAREWWAEGGKIRKAIGFDDSPHEHRRAERGCQTFAIQTDEKDKYEHRQTTPAGHCMTTRIDISPADMNKPITKVWTFASDSNPNIEYETLHTRMEPPPATARAGPAVWPQMAAVPASIPVTWTWAERTLTARPPTVTNHKPNNPKTKSTYIMAKITSSTSPNSASASSPSN